MIDRDVCRFTAPAALLMLAHATFGAIDVGGDPGQVQPLPASTWASSTTVMVGVDPGATGTLAVQGETLTSGAAWLGANDNTGHVQLSGTGTSWNFATAGIGSAGTGSLIIDSGATVYGSASTGATLVGHAAGSRGSLLISGPGSRLEVAHTFSVGGGGYGELTVRDGGRLVTPMSLVARSVGGFGKVLVTGAGSTWQSSGAIYAGGADAGTASITIADGGKIQLDRGDFGMTSNSRLDIHVSNDSMLVSNGFTWIPTTLYADAFMRPGTYKPMTDSSGQPLSPPYSPSNVTTVGGSYSGGVFTVTEPLFPKGNATLVPGGGRLFLPGGSMRTLGISVPAGAAQTIGARPMEAGTISLLPLPAETVLSAWEFDAVASDLLLSFKVDDGYAALDVWYFGGSTWELLDLDPIRSEQAVSFMAPLAALNSNGVGFAITSAVPEPAAVAMMSGALVLLARRRRVPPQFSLARAV